VTEQLRGRAPKQLYELDPSLTVIRVWQEILRRCG
jgi:hypothetical protein